MKSGSWYHYYLVIHNKVFAFLMQQFEKSMMDTHGPWQHVGYIKLWQALLVTIYQYKGGAPVNTGAFTIPKEYYHIFQQPQKRASCVPCGMRAILSHVTWAKNSSGLAWDARLRAHSHSTQQPLRSCLLQSCAPFALKLKHTPVVLSNFVAATSPNTWHNRDTFFHECTNTFGYFILVPTGL